MVGPRRSPAHRRSSTRRSGGHSTPSKSKIKPLAAEKVTGHTQIDARIPSKEKWFITHSLDTATSYAKGQQIYQIPNGCYVVRKIARSKTEVLESVEKRQIAEHGVVGVYGGYQGYSNWDTWETLLIMDNDQQTSRNMDAWSANFNRKIKAGTFNEEEAEKAVKLYIIPQARKQDPEIDPKKVNKAEVVHNIIERQEEG